MHKQHICFSLKVDLELFAIDSAKICKSNNNFYGDY